METRALITIAALCSAVPAAAGVEFPVCYDYSCKSTQLVNLDISRWGQVREVFEPGALTARHERQQLRHAVALMESLVGPITGTDADRGGNVEGSGTPGQMDCIDESTNTWTYLKLFQENGFLRWHETAERTKRSKWIIDVHWTAVIRERATGQQYAVDSWFDDNGKPPVIQRLEDWLAKKQPTRDSVW